jgi:hypothetical protein
MMLPRIEKCRMPDLKPQKEWERWGLTKQFVMITIRNTLNSQRMGKIEKSISAIW